jgi:DNA-binding IclR family transcriptional regulator
MWAPKGPPGAQGPSCTRVLLAVVILHRPTVRSVAAATGLSAARAHAQLVDLRRHGLVAWEDGKDGTLRPLVEVVG